MIKNKPDIDILLPYWGDPELFRQTVNSVLAQSNPNWRLLIFDDCYPSDEAQKYIATITDDRVVYHRHEKNIGITANFNYAIQNATSKYCVLIGCDDIMLPNYVDRSLALIADADFYQPSVDCIDKAGNIYLPLTDRVKRFLSPSKPGLYSGEKLATSLCYGNWLYFPSITWRTETIKKYGFDEKYKIAEDLDLEFKIISSGGILRLDNETTFHYRRFAESLSSKEKGKKGVRFSEENEVYAMAAKDFQQLGWHRASRAAHLRITSRLNKLIS